MNPFIYVLWIWSRYHLGLLIKEIFGLRLVGERLSVVYRG